MIAVCTRNPFFAHVTSNVFHCSNSGVWKSFPTFCHWLLGLFFSFLQKLGFSHLFTFPWKGVRSLMVVFLLFFGTFFFALFLNGKAFWGFPSSLWLVKLNFKWHTVFCMCVKLSNARYAIASLIFLDFLTLCFSFLLSLPLGKRRPDLF